MENRRQYGNLLFVIKSVVFVGVTITIVIPSSTHAALPVNAYSNYESRNPNISKAVFEARDGGSSYSAPLTSSSYGSLGGGYSNGGAYAAPEALIPTVYKYQMHPPKQIQSYGWAGGDDGDDDDGDFPIELIGLLGLKGLKGLKGLTGLLGLLKGLLLLLKLLAIPLLPILLPTKIGLALLKLLLILFLPVPVITTTAGRNLLESTTWISLRNILQDKLDSAMTNVSPDISHILKKIKGSSAETSWRESSTPVELKA